MENFTSASLSSTSLLRCWLVLVGICRFFSEHGIGFQARVCQLLLLQHVCIYV